MEFVLRRRRASQRIAQPRVGNATTLGPLAQGLSDGASSFVDFQKY